MIRSTTKFGAFGLAAALTLAACGTGATDEFAAGEGDADPAGTDTSVTSEAPTTTTTTTTEALFELDTPLLHAVDVPEGQGGELIYPDLCKPRSAGIAPRNDGFLFVARMRDDVPDTDNPPALPNGVTLRIIEFNIGIFDGDTGNDNGGGYRISMQYQIRDRTVLEIVDIGSGEAMNEEDFELDDIQVNGDEVRIQLPSLGPRTDNATHWGTSVTCVLRHPVDGFYFPSARIPPDQFERIELDSPIS